MGNPHVIEGSVPNPASLVMAFGTSYNGRSCAYRLSENYPAFGTLLRINCGKYCIREMGEECSTASVKFLGESEKGVILFGFRWIVFGVGLCVC